MELTICISLVCLTIVFTAYIYYKLKTHEIVKTYNANAQGWLLTKGDRICTRLENYARTVKTQNSTIDVKDFLAFVKASQVMIAQELTYKKYREEANKCK